jgi:electron transfer flavoprotein alpha subunit
MLWDLRPLGLTGSKVSPALAIAIAPALTPDLRPLGLTGSKVSPALAIAIAPASARSA